MNLCHRKDCRANANGFCTILNLKKGSHIIRPDSCPFFKTQKKHLMQLEHNEERLKSLGLERLIRFYRDAL